MATLDDPPFSEQAARLADGQPLPDLPAAAHAVALAWALKDLCYAAWSSEPRRAVAAARALSRLRDATQAAAFAEAAVREVSALAAWTAGIARVIEGDMEAAIGALDAAAAAFARLGRPGHAAQTLVPRIVALAMLGRDDEAVQCAEAAQRALLEQGDAATASKVLLNLANLHLRADRHAPAAERFEQAAALFEQGGDHEHWVMAENGLADALTAFGHFDAAAATYAGARARAEEHGFVVLQALAEESVALLDLVRGRYPQALAGLEGARRRYAGLAMPQRLAIAEKQLADAYLELRLLPEALAGCEAALERFEALDMQVDRAWTALQYGRALALDGQRAAAAKALADAARAFAQQRNAVGAAAVTLAQAELALAGGDASAAEVLSRDAAARFRQAGLVDRRLRAQTVQAQALLRLASQASGPLDAARALFDATLAEAREQGLLPVQLRCLAGGAMVAIAGGQRDAARAALEEAIELFEDQRRALPGDEIRTAFQADHLLPFQLLLALDLEALERAGAAAASANDSAARAVAAARVLTQLDRFRARTLADRLGADPNDEPNEEGRGGEGIHDLRAHLAWQYRRLRRLDDDGIDTTVLTRELRATERALLERTRRLRLGTAATKDAASARNDANGASSRPAGARAGLDHGALQALLRHGDVLVEYGVVDDELFACVVERDAVHVQRRLARWPQVLEAQRALRFQLESLRHGRALMQRHLPLLQARVDAHLGHLRAALWQPLAQRLGAAARVLVVPHGVLAAVPFAALPEGNGRLGDRLQVAVAPSARLAQRALARRAPAARSVLALGESARLRHAGAEADAVAGMLERGRAFVGEEATLASLLAHAGSADVLHLACHAQFRSDNPLFSALHLHDGVLTAEAVPSTLRLSGQIVVLSACETAMQDNSTGGGEMFGLTRAFLVAGASRVLAALWPVDDATTAELMSDFYAGLRRGHAPAAALRLAQLASRRRCEHPYFWAAFSLTGGW